MKSVVVKGIKPTVDQNQLKQLVELVGTVESVVYSDDNKMMQVNYQEEESVEKAIAVLNGLQINNVGLTFVKGTLEEIGKEQEEEKKNKEINWDKIRLYADRILSFPIELDEKTHFTEYCALGLALGISKCQQIDRDYQITDGVKSGFESIVSSISSVYSNVKESLTKQKKEGKEEDKELEIPEIPDQKEETEQKEETKEQVTTEQQ